MLDKVCRRMCEYRKKDNFASYDKKEKHIAILSEIERKRNVNYISGDIYTFDEKLRRAQILRELSSHRKNISIIFQQM